MRRRGIIEVEIDFVVPFHDVDMMGVVWHGHYLRHFENARWALMDRIGYGLHRMIDSGFAWPIVDLQARYVNGARFGDVIRTRAALIEFENRLVINYLMTRTTDSARIARAQTVQVAVDAHTGALQLASPGAFVAVVRAALPA